MNIATLQVSTSSGQNQTLHFNPPALLSTLLAQNGTAPDMPCGGRQKCLKCKIRVRGEVSPLQERERHLLTESEIADQIRYACMAEALGNVQVELLSKDAGHEYIQTEGVLPAFPLEPWGLEYGIAVDIGTTTVAAYLYRLSDGTLLHCLSERNPQAAFGADVISRLEKSLGGQSSALAAAIRGCLSKLVTALCRKQSLSEDAIQSMVITGNTAMLYLLTDRNPQSIAAAPFEPDTTFGCFTDGGALDLPCRHARIYLPRCLSAYVGADITTALLAAEFVKDGRVPEGAPRLLIDIGTNGEMALAAGGKLWCCSTAAGPAFEGAGITMGMSAIDGAIHRVALENGHIRCDVLGNRKAIGLCGSGLLDAVAVLCAAGVLDDSGLILEEDHAFVDCINEVNDQPAFRLPDTAVVLTQQDIRAVQLAKSAIRAGMETLVVEAGLPMRDIHELVIAGGFGSHINTRSAETIGLIPPDFSRRAYSIGNAAGSGASMVLLSETKRLESEHMAALSETVELSTSACFIDAYVENMLFPIG